jgi:hypothetical protein
VIQPQAERVLVEHQADHGNLYGVAHRVFLSFVPVIWGLEQRGFTLEYEQLLTLATVRGLGQVCWDALGQSLLVEVDIRHKDGRSVRLPVSLPPEVAEELFHRLDAALSERSREEPNRQ